jgi:hypothetical protein
VRRRCFVPLYPGAASCSSRSNASWERTSAQHVQAPCLSARSAESASRIRLLARDFFAGGLQLPDQLVESILPAPVLARRRTIGHRRLACGAARHRRLLRTFQLRGHAELLPQPVQLASIVSSFENTSEALSMAADWIGGSDSLR